MSGFQWHMGNGISATIPCFLHTSSLYQPLSGHIFILRGLSNNSVGGSAKVRLTPIRSQMKALTTHAARCSWLQGHPQHVLFRTPWRKCCGWSLDGSTWVTMFYLHRTAKNPESEPPEPAGDNSNRTEYGYIEKQGTWNSFPAKWFWSTNCAWVSVAKG